MVISPNFASTLPHYGVGSPCPPPSRCLNLVFGYNHGWTSSGPIKFYYIFISLFTFFNSYFTFLSFPEDADEDEEDNEGGGESDNEGEEDEEEEDEEGEGEEADRAEDKVAVKTKTEVEDKTKITNDINENDIDNEDIRSNSVDSNDVNTIPIKMDTKLTCGADRGGCDHECTMVTDENEVEPRIQCSCYTGFILDSLDGRTCQGK